MNRNAKKLIDEASAETAQRELAKAKLDTAKWRRKHAQAVKEAMELEGERDILLTATRPAKRRMFPPLSRSKRRNDVAVICPATDWHCEEVIEPESVNFKNSFNLPEAEFRIGRYYQKILRLLDSEDSISAATELWHPLLGDLMTGGIHDELIETNSLSSTEAVVFLREMLSTGIDLLLRETKLPIFLPCCVGNHGRTTTKTRIKTRTRNSFEWLLYKILESQYSREPRVKFSIAKGYHKICDIVGRRVRFHHGDGLRYMGGVGGISIPVNKAIVQWDKADSVDVDVFGHYHTMLWHYPKWVSCGSLMGYSEYSVEIKAEFQHPTQAFIVLDRLYGVTNAKPIFLTKSATEQRGKA